jgi:hypothetical protein
LIPYFKALFSLLCCCEHSAHPRDVSGGGHRQGKTKQTLYDFSHSGLTIKSFVVFLCSIILDWEDIISEQFQDIQINSINLRANHLKRDTLIEKLKLKVLATQFTLISSPPSTGKSSLLKLFLNKYKYSFKFVQCVDNMDAFELFKKATGIDLNSEKIDDTITKNERTMVIIDDAQCFYGNQLFWTSLLKHLPSWLGDNYKVSFIVSATHNISFLSSSPEGFNTIPKISNVDLKLSIEESYEVIELTFRKNHFSLSNAVKDFIVNQCGGVIGAVVISVVMIADKFAQHVPTETDILHYLCSGDFISCLSRVFGTFRDRVLPEFQVFL